MNQDTTDGRSMRANTRRKSRRAALLTAASKVFATRGYHQTRVSDIIEEAEDKVETLTKELNEQIEKNVELRNKVNDSACQMIFEEVSDTLTDTEVDKLRSLSEGLEYETQEQYKDKLAILKENYFNKSVSVTNSDPIENVDGSAEASPLSGPMSRYTNVLDKMKVKK